MVATNTVLGHLGCQILVTWCPCLPHNVTDATLCVCSRDEPTSFPQKNMVFMSMSPCVYDDRTSK